MEENKNFLPKFEITNDLSEALRNIEIAKALSVGWYKGQVDYHLRKAGMVKMINGEEYYTGIGLLFLQAQFFTEGTQGYHVAEFYRLLGMEDSDLKEMQKTASSNGVDGIYQTWKAKEGLSSNEFKRHLQNIKQELLDVDEIKIDYENQRYKNSTYPLETSRIYNTKESLYGDSLQWGQKQSEYGESNWTTTNRILGLEDIQKKEVEFAFGTNIRFYKLGVEVTDSYSDAVKFAVQSMIAYSGNEFMQRTSSVKTNETSYSVKQWTNDDTGTIENYTSVIGTETFDATIKQEFLDDINDRHFIRYSVLIKSSGMTKGIRQASYSESRDVLDGRVPLEQIEYLEKWITVKYMSYTNAFWKYVKGNNSSTALLSQIVNAGDEFLFYNTGNRDVGAYIKVKEFKKLTMEEIAYYFGEYFDIRVTTKKGGFFSGFIGAIAGLLGKILNLAFDIIMATPVLRVQLQLLTKLVNGIFGSELTDFEVFEILVQSAIAVLTAGLSIKLQIAIGTALTLAKAGVEAEDKKKSAEEQSSIDNKRKKELADIKKQENEEEEKQKKINNGEEESSRDEFEKFLKNPLYKVDDEENKMMSDMKSQFKLI